MTRTLIAGSRGFIGANLAESFLREGREAVLLDDLSRPGVEQNLAELTDRFGDRVHPAPVDLHDEMELAKVVADAESVVTSWRRGLRDLAGWLREARFRSDAAIAERLSA